MVSKFRILETLRVLKGLKLPFVNDINQLNDNAFQQGNIIYNTQTNELCYNNGSGWVCLSGSGGGGPTNLGNAFNLSLGPTFPAEDLILNDPTRTPVPTTDIIGPDLVDNLTIYVSNNGIDTNFGLSSATAVRTINRAFEILRLRGFNQTATIELENDGITPYQDLALTSPPPPPSSSSPLKTFFIGNRGNRNLNSILVRSTPRTYQNGGTDVTGTINGSGNGPVDSLLYIDINSNPNVDISIIGRAIQIEDDNGTSTHLIGSWEPNNNRIRLATSFNDFSFSNPSSYTVLENMADIEFIGIYGNGVPINFENINFLNGPNAFTINFTGLFNNCVFRYPENFPRSQISFLNSNIITQSPTPSFTGLTFYNNCGTSTDRSFRITLSNSFTVSNSVFFADYNSSDRDSRAEFSIDLSGNPPTNIRNCIFTRCTNIIRPQGKIDIEDVRFIQCANCINVSGEIKLEDITFTNQTVDLSNDQYTGNDFLISSLRRETGTSDLFEASGVVALENVFFDMSSTGHNESIISLENSSMVIKQMTARLNNGTNTKNFIRSVNSKISIVPFATTLIEEYRTIIDATLSNILIDLSAAPNQPFFQENTIQDGDLFRFKNCQFNIKGGNRDDIPMLIADRNDGGIFLIDNSSGTFENINYDTRDDTFTTGYLVLARDSNINLINLIVGNNTTTYNSSLFTEVFNLRNTRLSTDGLIYVRQCNNYVVCRNSHCLLRCGGTFPFSANNFELCGTFIRPTDSQITIDNCVSSISNPSGGFTGVIIDMQIETGVISKNLVVSGLDFSQLQTNNSSFPSQNGLCNVTETISSSGSSPSDTLNVFNLDGRLDVYSQGITSISNSVLNNNTSYRNIVLLQGD